MGKTSLRARGLQQAREAGARVVFTDLQKLSVAQLASADCLFRAFARAFIVQLSLESRLNDIWDSQDSVIKQTKAPDAESFFKLAGIVRTASGLRSPPRRGTAIPLLARRLRLFVLQ